MDENTFEPITTQEDFTARIEPIIKDRVARAQETASKKYADYESLKAKVTELTKVNEELAEQVKSVAEKDTEIEALKLQNAKYETDSAKTRIALEKKIPTEYWKYITGSNEEEITASADGVLKDWGTKQNANIPLASTDTKPADDKKELMRETLRGLNLGG